MNLQCDPDPALGLTCIVDASEVNGTCRRLAEAGDPCGDLTQAECGPGLGCLPVAGDGGGTSSGDGGRMSSGGMLTGICGPLPRLDERCASVLACEEGTCTSLRCVGGCRMFPVCAEGVCDSETSICVLDRNGPTQSVCTNNADCLSGDCEQEFDATVCWPRSLTIELTCRVATHPATRELTKSLGLSVEDGELEKPVFHLSMRRTNRKCLRISFP